MTEDLAGLTVAGLLRQKRGVPVDIPLRRRGLLPFDLI